MLYIDKFVQEVVANEMIFINTYGNNQGSVHDDNYITAQMPKCVKGKD